MSIDTTEIQLKVGRKTAGAHLAAPKSGGPGVLLLHAWWGLKPFFKQVSHRLAEQGFTSLAPDLYNGQIASTIDEAETLMKSRDSKYIRGAILAAMDFLASKTNGKPIRLVGFSMGASLSLRTAAEFPERVSALVLFYGVNKADFSRVQARILGHFAELDEWEPLKYVQKTEAAMRAAGLGVTFHIYPGAAHWFVEEDRPEYDPAAAQLAWERTFEFLKKAS